MITSSIVIYHSPEKDLQTVISCVANSIVHKIYVIDNAPDDRLKEFIKSLSEKTVYIQGQGNVGYGAAHNIALREAIRQGVTCHLVLNADIVFSEGVIEKLAAFMDAHPNAGQVIPKIVYPTGELQYACKLLPTPFDLLFRRFLPPKMNVKRANKFELKFTGYDKIMNVPYHHGCFMFFRVSALNEIGLFDERFFMYPEDIDITRRMHEKYATLFYPGVEVVHAHAAASRKNLKMLWIHMNNMIRYFNKWGWFFDKKRRKTNRQVLKELHYK
jgi:GT2 family glycosyltransferase